MEMDDYILTRVVALLIEKHTGFALPDVQAEKIGKAVGLLASGLYIDSEIWAEDSELSPMIEHAIGEWQAANGS